jgi:ATP-dependent RNA helicase RhlE
MNEQAQFYGLGIAPRLLEIIEKRGFKVPTPIQQKAIPIGIAGKDLIGIAQTGTGKTLAFGIPLLQRISNVKGIGLIILPTRELAVQVEESLQNIGKSFGLKTAVLIGGAPMDRQIMAIRKQPHIVIGTPGRIIDHLERKILKLETVSTLVLDEADRMLDMGFAPQIKIILNAVPKERQTMLFSATMPDDIVRIATNHMKLPVRIEIARAGSAAENVTQELFIVSRDEKNRLLEKLLDQYQGTVLIFSRTKFGAKKICRAIRAIGHSAAEIHSNKSLAQRRDALEGFKSGKYRVLVATDIASRGIDVTGIELVVNYDIPENPEDYVHRIGRTGRAGQAGRAVSFATPDQRHKIRDIERLVRMALQVSKVPELPPARAPIKMPYEPSSQPSRRPYQDRGPRGSQRGFQSRTPRYNNTTSRPSPRPSGAGSSRGPRNSPRFHH